MFPMNIGIEVEGPWPKTSSVGPGSSKAFGKPFFGFSLSFLRNVPEGTLDAMVEKSSEMAIRMGTV